MALADVATTMGDRIGRHFSVVSMLPSLFLTLWSYLLLASGSVAGSPHVGRLTHAFTSLGQAAWLIVIALVVALLMHPLQFPATQILEGYWGISALGHAAMTARVLHHRQVRQSLLKKARDAQRDWKQSSEVLAPALKPLNLLDSARGNALIGSYLMEQEARRLLQRYPHDGRRVMPTRLGNVLRHFEDSAGKPYNLDTLQVIPRLAMIAPAEQVAYVQDARREMDTAISMCLAALLATAVSAVTLITDHAWLLLALAPYAIAYLAYRGAVAAAAEYGTALSVMIDLSRFELYDKMQLIRPTSLADEQVKNAAMEEMLSGNSPEQEVPYRSSSVADGTDAG